MYDDELIQRNFARRLKELREDSGLSQGDLAEKLGVSRGSISNYENCTRIPDITFLVRASDFFRVGTSYLLGDSDNKEPKYEDIGLLIDFSDEAIKKIASGSGRFDYGRALSEIIEHDNFEKLFAIAEYFFLPLRYCGKPNYLNSDGFENEIEYYIFQLSRVFTSILLDIKLDVVEYFFNLSARRFTESDIERKQFLSDKRARELAHCSMLAQKANNWIDSEMQRWEDEYQMWKSEKEAKIAADCSTKDD